eukprot:SAG11_NODE_19427_length_466_cov_8.792916_1_plen_34_part_01
MYTRTHDRCRYKTVGDKNYDTGEELKAYLYKYTR